MLLRSLLHTGSVHQRMVVPIALVSLLGCSSNIAPPDPELVAATRAENQHLAELRRAAAAREELEAAEYAELQQNVLAIESEHRSEPPPLLTDDELDQVLGYYCGECHLPIDVQSQAVDGMYYIDDMDELIATGKVIPGDAEASRLVRRMRAGEMPPGYSDSPTIPESTIDLVADFINSLPPHLFPGDLLLRE